MLNRVILNILSVVQFIPFNDVPFDIPEGVKLWPDENGLQPKDGSWGYISAPKNHIGPGLMGSNRQHVFSGDWIITITDGKVFALNETEFTKRLLSELT
jgi:hypothetical protein